MLNLWILVLLGFAASAVQSDQITSVAPKVIEYMIQEESVRHKTNLVPPTVPDVIPSDPLPGTTIPALTNITLDIKDGVINVTVDTTNMALSVNNQLNVTCKQVKGIMLDVNAYLGILIPFTVDGHLSLNLEKNVSVTVTPHGESDGLPAGLLSSLLKTVSGALKDKLGTGIDVVMGVINQELREVQNPTCSTEDAVVQVVATGVKLVGGVLQITSKVIDKVTKTPLDIGSSPVPVLPPGGLVAVNIHENLISSYLNLLKLKLKLQISSSPFKDQVSEDVTLEDYLDLEMSITSANCSLRKDGSTLSLGIGLKVVSESLGVLMSVTANTQVGISLNATKCKLRFSFGKLSDLIQINVTSSMLNCNGSECQNCTTVRSKRSTTCSTVFELARKLVIPNAPNLLYNLPSYTLKPGPLPILVRLPEEAHSLISFKDNYDENLEVTIY